LTSYSRYDTKLPNGCYIKPDGQLLARSRNSLISQDASLNFMLASGVVSYIVPTALMVAMIILLRTTRWTQVRRPANLSSCHAMTTSLQDGKLNRFYKMAMALCVVFIATKSPVDIYSFAKLISTAMPGGFSIVNQRPDELGRIRY
jgi:hypothetical protein